MPAEDFPVSDYRRKYRRRKEWVRGLEIAKEGKKTGAEH
jgi:hypothetical protein